MPYHTHVHTTSAIIPATARDELILKVEELEGWLAKINKVHVSVPQESRSNIDRAFLEMIDELEVYYKRALRTVNRRLGYPSSEDDAGSGNDSNDRNGDTGHRGSRVLVDTASTR